MGKDNKPIKKKMSNKRIEVNPATGKLVVRDKKTGKFSKK